MNTRSEAIQYLQSHGYKASKRDWSLGKTIRILAGETQQIQMGEDPEEVVDVEIWSDQIWLYPDGKGWAIYYKDRLKFSSLSEAVLAAIEIAAAINNDRSSPEPDRRLG
jgi:hypothetical protein